MKCSRCQHENEAGAKFCEECAAPLARACVKCGRQLSPTAKFCPECAYPTGASTVLPPAERFGSPESYTPKHLAERILTSKSSVEGERKQVTALFADVKSSMELFADRDPEEARKLLDPVLEQMMEAVHRFEGTIIHVLGDGIVALFGAPLGHEDHAVRACYAALRMQETVKRYAEGVRRSEGIPVQIRVGLNSGEVVVRSISSDLRMDYTVVGQTINVAARMEQMAVPGSILMSADTMAFAEGYVQVRPLGPSKVKGLERPLEVFELTGAAAVRSRLHAAAARGLTRFVGRDVELEQLRQALERAANGHGQVVAVVGEPGVGKSRLYWEFTRSHRTQGWLIVESSSVSYGKATAFLPIMDLLRGYFQIQPDDKARKIRERATGKLLALDRALESSLPALLWLLDIRVDDPQWQKLDAPQRRQQALDGIKHLLLRESQVQPVLVLFEDLHWIDAETQALLDALVESMPTARLLLLVNYRPEYRHGWNGKTYYGQLRIDPLSPESAEELLEALLGRDPSLQPLKRLLIERTDGNPFFLEESVRTLVETKALAGERGAYRLERALQAPQIPATAQAILAARIDRLLPEDKRLLQAASVVGKDVPLELLRAIVDEEQETLRRGLSHLQAAEFLYEARLFPVLRNVAQSLQGDLSRERFGQHAFPAVNCRSHLVWALAELGDFDEGIAQAQEGVRLAESVDHPYSLVVALWGLGCLYGIRGEYSNAIRPLDRALALTHEWSLPGLAPIVMAASGYFYALSGRVADGLALLRQAFTAMESMRFTLFHSFALMNAGEVCALAGRMEEAVALAERALTLTRERGERGFEAWALRLLGEIFTRHEPPEVEKANAAFRAAHTLATELGMRPLIAHAHLGLGNLSQRTGRREQAQKHLSTATSMYREMDMRSWFEKAEGEIHQLR